MNLNGWFTLTVVLAFFTATSVSAQPSGGSAHDILPCVERTSDGHFLVGGYSSSFMAEETAAIISLLTLDGDPLWTTDYDSDFWDETTAVMADENGYYWLAGATRTDDDDFDWLVGKYSGNGQPVWEQVYFTEGPSAAVDLVADESGGAYVTGFVEIDGDKQLGLIHINADGNLLWSYNSDYSLIHVPCALAPGQDGSLLVAGQRNASNDNASDLFIAAFTVDGIPAWDVHLILPLAQHCTGIDVTPSGDILLSGYTVADTESEQTDGLLVKFSSDGEFQWQTQFGDTGNDRCYGVAGMEGDSALVCGVYQDPVTFEELAVLYLTDPDGQTVWSRMYAFNEHAEFRDVASVSSTEFMAVGFADPGDPWMTDYMIANATTAIAPDPVLLPSEVQALAYPNPTNAAMTLELTIPRSTDLTVLLTNIAGQQVGRIAYGRFTAGIHHLPVSLHHVASGNYFITLQGGAVHMDPLRIVVVK